MTQPKVPIPTLMPMHKEGGLKRRKVRKGTQSCWECKRRKTRCIFSDSDSPVCDGCRRRETQCLGQEFFDEPASNRRDLKERLLRVEGLVDQIANGRSGNRAHAARRFFTARNDSRPQHQAHVQISQSDTEDLNSLEEPPPSTQRHCERLKLNQVLLTAWPSASDLGHILSAPIETSTLYHGLIFTSYSRFFAEDLPSIQTVLKIPSEESHPVFFARKLLTLALLLQNSNAVVTQYLSSRLETTQQTLMTNALDTATRTVVSNDTLVSSVEGIECIMMESRFYNNVGNLRRSYLTMRRALVTAQMLGLDRGVGSSLINYLDSHTRQRISPSHMWLCIMQSDRYLSLMLGLPPGSFDDAFILPKAMQDYTPMEGLERSITFAAGRILQRKRSDILDIRITREVDQLLLDSASLLPPQWWLKPKPSTNKCNEIDSLHDTIRIMNQFAYFHLVQRLHLPYLLHQTSDRKYDYNKLTAITASRELLSRYVAFCCSQPEKGSLCRGVEFLGFIASTTLCLGHIDTRLQRDYQSEDEPYSSGDMLFGCLAHQRLGDRAMMEQMLKSMESVARTRPGDLIAPQIAQLLEQLLAIESDVAKGVRYERSLQHECEEEELTCNGKLSDGGDALSIFISHIGTIKFERDGIRRVTMDMEMMADHELLDQNNGEQQAESTMGMNEDVVADFSGENGQHLGWSDPIFGTEGDWTLQGVDLTFFDTLFPTGDNSR